MLILVTFIIGSIVGIIVGAVGAVSQSAETFSQFYNNDPNNHLKWLAAISTSEKVNVTDLSVHSLDTDSLKRAFELYRSKTSRPGILVIPYPFAALARIVLSEAYGHKTATPLNIPFNAAMPSCFAELKHWYFVDSFYPDTVSTIIRCTNA